MPQFYGGRIQLLLPLCLTGDKPELALTIQREDGFYAARTCLTLDMAYNNARLICRPETSWSSDKGWFNWWFVGCPDCCGAVCAREFKIGSKKFLVNHARLC